MQVFILFAKNYISHLYITILKSILYTIEQTILLKNFKKSTMLD